MQRIRRRRKKKKILVPFVCVLTMVFLFQLFMHSVSYVSAFVSKATVLSAGIMLPEGGNTLLQNEISHHDTVSSKAATQTVDENAVSRSDTKAANVGTIGEIDTGISQAEIDSYDQHDGAIIRKTYKEGSSEKYISIGDNAYIENSTKVPNDTVLQAANTAPAFQIDANSTEPQVLIMHTHTTESYELAARDFYDNRLNARSRDQSRNVVRVGDAIAQQLEAAGIKVIHDTTEHDYPSYNGSYDRSKKTDESYLEKYPSIKIILDIHRDAISDNDGNHYAPVANINGKNAAQVMIISGCDDGTMDYPNYLNNLSFASMIQKQACNDYPNLMRPVAFKYKYYNQSLTTGSLLFEVGAFANSLEEAIYAGQLVGNSMATALKSMTK